ncbi:MAG: alpha/beta hydrolase [Chloroflexota bacterium]|nr:alpha/beta hydrolase [Chloroflexota bacterium]
MDIVLVHGAWHGGWCWRKLAPFFASSNHRLFAPTLSGLGERSHIAANSISLETHINDIVSLLQYEDIKECVLVGHSYAGMVISGVVNRLPERIAHLIYVDAVIPKNGESFVECVPKWTGLRERILATEGFTVKPIYSGKPFGITNAEDISWVHTKITPHPTMTLTDKLLFDETLIEMTPKTYLHCIADLPEQAFEGPPVSRTKNKQGWTYYGLPVGHDIMIIAPGLLSGIIMDITSMK